MRTWRFWAVKFACLAAPLPLLSGCGGGGNPPPSCNGCGPTTTPSPFAPGALPGSAASLDGPRCATTGSNLGVFNNVLLAARLADTSVNRVSFAANDPFLIYWSVCNVGAGSSGTVATPQGLQVTGPSFGQTFSYMIPALASCQCVVPIPQVQFASGLATPGGYTATLVGNFTTRLAFTITP
jgi:hypothetical protein